MFLPLTNSPVQGFKETQRKYFAVHLFYVVCHWLARELLQTNSSRGRGQTYLNLGRAKPAQSLLPHEGQPKFWEHAARDLQDFINDYAAWTRGKCCRTVGLAVLFQSPDCCRPSTPNYINSLIAGGCWGGETKTNYNEAWRKAVTFFSENVQLQRKKMSCQNANKNVTEPLCINQTRIPNGEMYVFLYSHRCLPVIEIKIRQ